MRLSRLSESAFPIGYYCGVYTTRLLKCTIFAEVGAVGCDKINKIASAHKLNLSDKSSISENLWQCLEYLNY